MKVRDVLILLIARKPTPDKPSTSKVMVFAAFPKAPSELAARTPAKTSIVAPAPPKVLPELVSTNVPGPDLVSV